MKKLFFLSLSIFLFLSSTIYNPEDYDEGYKEGYCEGYRDCKGTPYASCVIPPYINNQPYINGLQEYKDGWKEGFKHGQKDHCR